MCPCDSCHMFPNFSIILVQTFYVHACVNMQFYTWTWVYLCICVCTYDYRMYRKWHWSRIPIHFVVSKTAWLPKPLHSSVPSSAKSVNIICHGTSFIFHGKHVLIHVLSYAVRIWLKDKSKIWHWIENYQWVTEIFFLMYRYSVL